MRDSDKNAAINHWVLNVDNIHSMQSSGRNCFQPTVTSETFQRAQLSPRSAAIRRQHCCSTPEVASVSLLSSVGDVSKTSNERCCLRWSTLLGCQRVCWSTSNSIDASWMNEQHHRHELSSRCVACRLHTAQRGSFRGECVRTPFPLSKRLRTPKKRTRWQDFVHTIYPPRNIRRCKKPWTPGGGG